VLDCTRLNPLLHLRMCTLEGGCERDRVRFQVPHQPSKLSVRKLAWEQQHPGRARERVTVSAHKRLDYRLLVGALVIAQVREEFGLVDTGFAGHRVLEANTVETSIAAGDPHVVDLRVGPSKEVDPDRLVKVASGRVRAIRRVFKNGLVDVDAHASTVRRESPAAQPVPLAPSCRLCPRGGSAWPTSSRALRGS